MFAPVRVGFFAALFALACVTSSVTLYPPPASAQTSPDRPFQREDLEDGEGLAHQPLGVAGDLQDGDRRGEK